MGDEACESHAGHVSAMDETRGGAAKGERSAGPHTVSYVVYPLLDSRQGHDNFRVHLRLATLPVPRLPTVSGVGLGRSRVGRPRLSVGCPHAQHRGRRGGRGAGPHHASAAAALLRGDGATAQGKCVLGCGFGCGVGPGPHHVAAAAAVLRSHGADASGSRAHISLNLGRGALGVLRG